MNRLHFNILLTAIVLVYVIGMIQIPLMDIDAAQYASISREMLESKSYLQVFDRGKDYLDKPPMLFWLSAFSMKFFGVHDWSYRIPSILFLLIACYSTFQFTKLYYTQRTAQLATLILASSQAFFLIAHDVRTDTMLVGWVMLSIYLLAKWSLENRNQLFFAAMTAIAGGMMTKGPIALVVPVLCFAPHWLVQKKWEFFYKPIYILGIIWIAILLIPMSVGLYQQYDLHPGKLINQIPISSGLKFYYWTQSFGRYTGENFYHEMSYPTFLLENMFWSFLPWIFVFLWAIGYRILNWVRNGFQPTSPELISFFGFILTYIVLSRSQAQLPHYIFVVFPLASIIVASHWDALLWSSERISKGIKWFYGFHLFIFSILCSVLVMIAFVPFGRIHWAGIIFITFLIIILLLIVFSKQALGQKWFYLSLYSMLGVNLILNSHFYPQLLPYQWGNRTAAFMDQQGIDKNKVMAYQLPNSYALHFYGQHIFPVNMDSAAFEIAPLKNVEYVVTDKTNEAVIFKKYPQAHWIMEADRFHVTLLTLPFLNPATRFQETHPYGILQLHK